MRTLLLLRHAKSSWNEPGLRDHDRPLNKRGRREAPRIGELLRTEGVNPDLVVSSTAARTRETVDLLLAGLGGEVETRFTSELYLASAADCLAAAAECSDDCTTVLIVAHNPGLEDLVAHLSGHYESFPTAALARFEIDVEHWRDLDMSSPSRLTGLWRPKEL